MRVGAVFAIVNDDSSLQRVHCFVFVSLTVQIIDLWVPLVCGATTSAPQQMHRRISSIKMSLFSMKSWIMRMWKHPGEIQKAHNGPLSTDLESNQGRVGPKEN